MESVLGVNKDIRVQMESLCKRCNGKKAEPGTTLHTCPKCNGTGQVITMSNVFSSFKIFLKRLISCES